jgi:hypothetical protein
MDGCDNDKKVLLPVKLLNWGVESSVQTWGGLSFRVSDKRFLSIASSIQSNANSLTSGPSFLVQDTNSYGD